MFFSMFVESAACPFVLRLTSPRTMGSGESVKNATDPVMGSTLPGVDRVPVPASFTVATSGTY